MTNLKNKKLNIIVLLICLITVIVTGCGFKSKTETVGNKMFHDDVGRTVNIEKTTKIVALSNSFLDILNALDANVIGIPNTKETELNQYFNNAEKVGFVYNINIEKVVALKPDLVIAYQGIHDKFVPILEANNIPVIVIKMKTYDDVVAKIKLLSEITDNVAKGEMLINSLAESINKVKSALPEEGKSIVILHSTARDVTVELESSIAGSTAKTLGLKNLANNAEALSNSQEMTPYSLEKLVSMNPEIIFVTIMGKEVDLKNKMLQEMKNNPAWASLKAVQNNQVYFLEQDLFQINPGLRYPEAMGKMAKLAYPEVVSNGNK